MGHINYTLKKLLLCFTVIVLTVVINNNFVFTTNAQAGTHTIFGFIEYGNGEPTPNDVTVVLTDPGKGSTTVQTFTEAGVTGFYYIDDIYIILGTDDKPGDEMDVSVDYGGCTGSETFTAKQEGTDKIDITITGNLPPNIPDQPTGSSSGYTHISYNFSTKTTDQDAPADQVKYGWDWDGDSVVDDWTGLYDSNETCTISHIWNSAGTCSIKVKAQDEHGAEKGVAWSDTFDVTISNILPVAGSPIFEILL